MEENESSSDAKNDVANGNLKINNYCCIQIVNIKISGDDDATYQHKLEVLQADMRKMQNEFNTQRAKMKELYMQKEAERKQLQEELDELRTHVMVADLKSENEMQMKDIRAQEEISSLQQLVQDTIEESATYKAELERIKLDQLRQQQQQLQQPAEPSGGLAPHVLNQVKKTLGSVRKLGSDSLNNSFQQETPDGNTRGIAKNNVKQYVSIYAQASKAIEHVNLCIYICFTRLLRMPK